MYRMIAASVAVSSVVRDSEFALFHILLIDIWLRVPVGISYCCFFNVSVTV